MSTIKVDTIKNTSNVEVFTAKAWVNFNGTGTVAIRASGNVSSITDLGTGVYTVNFTTAMADANYATTLATGLNASNGFNISFPLIATTNSVRVYTYGAVGTGAGAYLDTSEIDVSIFR